MANTNHQLNSGRESPSDEARLLHPLRNDPNDYGGDFTVRGLHSQPDDVQAVPELDLYPVTVDTEANDPPELTPLEMHDRSVEVAASIALRRVVEGPTSETTSPIRPPSGTEAIQQIRERYGLGHANPRSGHTNTGYIL